MSSTKEHPGDCSCPEAGCWGEVMPKERPGLSEMPADIATCFANPSSPITGGMRLALTVGVETENEEHVEGDPSSSLGLSTGLLGPGRSIEELQQEEGEVC
jgi:hypothetical protein